MDDEPAVGATLAPSFAPSQPLGQNGHARRRVGATPVNAERGSKTPQIVSSAYACLH
jgi:hypothetical protein